MAKLKESDFYYGAILSHLFNKGICPMLVESGDDRQVYEFTTNDGEFRLFAKYRSTSSATMQENYCSWQFVFSADDISELKDYIAQPQYLSVGLVCGKIPLNTSEIAFLNKEELQELFTAGKTSFTISRRKGEKSFRVSVGGGREQAVQIKCTRVY